VVNRLNETYSGLTLERPMLAELRELVRSSQLDVIVIYCLDRLSRNATHGVIIRDELDKNDVILESVTEDINTSPLGEAITYLRGTFSQIEAEKIRERTMRGKQARLKEGKLPLGTGIGVYGYSWKKETGKRQIIDHEADTVRKIFSMAISGISINRMANTLNESGIRSKSGSLWHRQTVKRLLSNPDYTGKTYFGRTKRVSKTRVKAQPEEEWILLPDITPPIITDEIFNQAQEALKGAKLARPLKSHAPYLLTGFIRCSKCGSTIFGTTLKGNYRYYKCFGASPTPTRGRICDAGYIRSEEVETFVWEKLVKLWSSPLTLLSMFTDANYDSRRSIIPMLDKQIKQLRKRLKTYPAKEKKLYDLLTSEDVTKDYILDAVSTIKKSREDDQHQLTQLLESRKQSAQTQQITVKLTEFSDAMRNSISEDMTINEKRTILEGLGVQIQASPGNYKFTCSIDTELTSDIDESVEKLFYEEAKKLEAAHPDLTFGDLIDQAVKIPDDTVIGQVINNIKSKRDLVTSAHTSLSSCNGAFGEKSKNIFAKLTLHDGKMPYPFI